MNFESFGLLAGVFIAQNAIELIVSDVSNQKDWSACG
jgi:hypothetical protein